MKVRIVPWLVEDDGRLRIGAVEDALQPAAIFPDLLRVLTQHALHPAIDEDVPNVGASNQRADQPPGAWNIQVAAGRPPIPGWLALVEIPEVDIPARLMTQVREQIPTLALADVPDEQRRRSRELL